jgi:predicted helicase
MLLSMNESSRVAIISKYLEEVREQFESGHAVEHAYRPALKALMSNFEDTVAVNDPKHSEHGAPDFVFLKRSNNKIIKGYAEAKDITVSLDKTEKSDQMQRYAGYANLFLTDYLEFRFFRNGEKYETISLGHVKNGQLHLTPENGERLTRELEAFLEQTPEQIRNGKRLAQIMGGKARRIRDNVEVYLTDKSIESEQFESIYELMKKALVHDLTEQKFADMYAQTLVYGLFVARYSDDTPDNFTRSEARDLVPRSNPFLRKFFDHIAGADFDTRLSYIVDELCEVFSVSDVADIVHKHLRIQETSSDVKDPIIHFYEDFLKEYDPELRKHMGAYYTPVPVVRYIVRQVDRILKEDFDITKGLASTENITRTVDTQPWRKKGEHKDRTTKEISVPRVQILDPAVGTATFLNETIKFIYEGFKGQEGQWPSYVNNNLLERLHGFELMMAPYTIAHLKLGMTLKELGVKDLTKRLGVYLTNTLEPGSEVQMDLLSNLGLSGAVSEESRLASIVKNETPVMVVIGNPPYSVSSSNKGKWIQNLIKEYKKDLNERKINLDDDYIKFIRFAENMIEINGNGVVAMITNNSYIDGVTHRQMRKHLLQTFDKIYILDLHGNSKKKEAAPDGGKDENVFDIMQGVSIVLMVKTGRTHNMLSEVYYSELFGTRKHKFITLDSDKPEFSQIEASAPGFFFVPKDFGLQNEYDKFININSLFIANNTGIQTKNDKLSIQFDENSLDDVINNFQSLDLESLTAKYMLKTSSGWSPEKAKNDIINSSIHKYKLLYRPFDKRWSLITSAASGFIGRQRMNVTPSMLKPNVGLITLRINGVGEQFVVLATDTMIEKGSLPRGNYSIFPLYIYHADGTYDTNFNQKELKKLTVNLNINPSPEDIFDYIYATLHSPTYRKKYKEFLKTDFPRVSVPTQADFDRLVLFGRELRELHLILSPVTYNCTTTYPEAGDDVVEKVIYSADKVWINDIQYFGNVPELAWNFYIGGYQPAQKWLKDRKGYKLTNEDINHYQRIIKILLETDRIMKQIE